MFAHDRLCRTTMYKMSRFNMSLNIKFWISRKHLKLTVTRDRNSSAYKYLYELRRDSDRNTRDYKVHTLIWMWMGSETVNINECNKTILHSWSQAIVSSSVWLTGNWKFDFRRNWKEIKCSSVARMRTWQWYVSD
jgi:hypothetical protein